MFKSSGFKECLGGYYQNKVLETPLVSYHYLVLLDWTSQTAKTSWMEYIPKKFTVMLAFFSWDGSWDTGRISDIIVIVMVQWRSLSFRRLVVSGTAQLRDAQPAALTHSVGRVGAEDGLIWQPATHQIWANVCQHLEANASSVWQEDSG